MTEKRTIDQMKTNPKDEIEKAIVSAAMDNETKQSTDHSKIVMIKNDDLEMNVFRADTIKIKRQPWLWPGFIPMHTTTLFAGAGGIGKSQLLMRIAGYVADGKPFQACGFEHEIVKGGVLYIDGENDPEYQFAPKLMALETDLTNIYYAKGLITGNISHGIIDLHEKLEIVEKKIEALKNIKLIIIDPIHYFTGNLKDHVSGEVSAFISSLNALAKKYDLAIILNKHTRKKASGADGVAAASDEVAGSGAWVNSVRQSWIVAIHPEDSNKRLLCNLKVNIAKKSDEAMVYRINEKSLTDDEGNEVKTTILEWDEKTETITADDALSKERYNKSKHDNGFQLVINHLEKNGQSRWKDIYEAAQKAGISKRTMDRVIVDIETNYKKMIEISRGIAGAKILKLYNLDD